MAYTYKYSGISRGASSLRLGRVAEIPARRTLFGMSGKGPDRGLDVSAFAHTQTYTGSVTSLFSNQVSALAQKARLCSIGGSAHKG